MSHYRAQVVWPFFSNMPSDVMTNTFSFAELTPMSLQEAGDELIVHIRTFYQLVYGTTYLANYIVPANAHVNFYRIEDAPPRVPYTLPLGIAPITVSASTVPTETSCVLSFQGDRLSGSPQARRRGRIYIGGLATATMVSSTVSAYPTLNALFTAGVRTAADNLMDDLPGSGLRWCVWSPTDQNSVLVTNGWVDNSPDTQRRRSVDAASRILFPI